MYTLRKWIDDSTITFLMIFLCYLMLLIPQTIFLSPAFLLFYLVTVLYLIVCSFFLFPLLLEMFKYIITCVISGLLYVMVIIWSLITVLYSNSRTRAPPPVRTPMYVQGSHLQSAVRVDPVGTVNCEWNKLMIMHGVVYWLIFVQVHIIYFVYDLLCYMSTISCKINLENVAIVVV